MERKYFLRTTFDNFKISLSVRAFIALIPLILMAIFSVFRPEIINSSRTLFVSSINITIPEFISQKQQPLHITIPEKINSTRSTLKIRLQFKVPDTQSYKNILQTADTNQGFRAELHEGVLGLVFSTNSDGKTPPSAIVFPEHIKNGEWHTLTITLNNGIDLTARIDDSNPIVYNSIPPNVLMDNFILGQGFSNERLFNGEIRNFHVEISNNHALSFAYWVYSLLRMFLISLFIILIVILFKGVDQTTENKKNILDPTKLKKDPLLGLRGIACLLVLLGHFFMVVFPPIDITARILTYHHSLFWILAASPWGGVWLFFTLSGYLMGKGFTSGRYSIDLSGFTRFYKNRALRIFPLYFISIILVGIFVSPAIFNLHSADMAFTMINNLLFDNQGAAPIGALWSVSTEVQFYLFVPFIFILLRPLLANIKQMIMALVVIVSISLSYKYWIMSTMGMSGWHQFVYIPFGVNIDIFLIGFITAFISQQMVDKKITIHHGISIGVGMVVFMYLLVSYCSSYGMFTSNASLTIKFLAFAPSLTALLAATCIFFLDNATRHPASTNIFARAIWAVSTFSGLLTYSLYVWHEPILISLRKTAPAELSLSDCIQYFVYIILAVGFVAFIFYRFIEVPFDKLKHETK